MTEDEIVWNPAHVDPNDFDRKHWESMARRLKAGTDVSSPTCPYCGQAVKDWHFHGNRYESRPACDSQPFDSAPFRPAADNAKAPE